MKKIFPILALVVTLAACKTKVSTETKTDNAVMVDTTGFSEKYNLTAAGDNKFVITEKAVVPETPVAPVRKRAPRRNTGTSSPDNTVYSSGTSTTTNASIPKQDKGWSDAAKGTAIGGGAGAILGAVIADKKGKGAVIGGIIGAGAGYAIGRAGDRKSGRVERTRERKENGY